MSTEPNSFYAELNSDDVIDQVTRTFQFRKLGIQNPQELKPPTELPFDYLPLM
jgi:hypothetical protein